ncbi:MAG: 4Fe-4S binding protein, partial [Candidatus Bathyarchaeia archaeon]
MVNLQTEMAGLKFKNPFLAGCAGITATSYVIGKWLKAGAAGFVGKSLTTDPLLRQTIRPIFYPLNKYGSRGAMTESELLSHLSPKVWFEEEAPAIKQLCKEHNAVWIQSIVGTGVDRDDWAQLARLVQDAGADAVELDLGCPLAGGESEAYESIELGEDPVTSAMLIHAVKKAVDIPVGAKLSPTIRRLDKIALACESAGVDFFSAINAPAGFAIDVEKEEIVGANTFVGYIPGPSHKWWGLWKVAQVASACKVPISGVGGIHKGYDAVEYMLLGCPTFQVVSALYFQGIKAIPQMLNDITKFMEKKGYREIGDFRGKCLDQLKLYRDVPKENTWDMYPRHTEESAPLTPRFDVDNCNFCMLCVDTCLVDAIQADKGKREITSDPARCYSCGWCAGICPTDAVELVHARTGRV